MKSKYNNYYKLEKFLREEKDYEHAEARRSWFNDDDRTDRRYERNTEEWNLKDYDEEYENWKTVRKTFK